MTARSANHRDPRRTRDAILAAAQDEFATKGLSGARVDAIATRARANKRMIYHYFGSKEGLYLAALERVYEGLRGTERTLDLDHLEPEDAIARLVEFNFDYSRRHPELISLINNENLHRARHLRRSEKIRELHSPLVTLIRDILKRGVAKGVFRAGIDPVHLYITIAAVGYFYLSNNWTLSAIFGRDLGADAACRRRKQHNVDIIHNAIAYRPPVFARRGLRARQARR
ncbi:MAG: TetR family transcriptional regulator [Proteobacteria bacterium]|nr:TetR family transcriptional regulator [Pseudomonadota bacterium]